MWQGDEVSAVAIQVNSMDLSDHAIEFSQRDELGNCQLANRQNQARSQQLDLLFEPAMATRNFLPGAFCRESSAGEATVLPTTTGPCMAGQSRHCFRAVR